jgi:hypothetical protein
VWNWSNSNFMAGSLELKAMVGNPPRLSGC